MIAGSNPYASPASESEYVAVPRRIASTWQLCALHAGLALVYVGLVLLFISVILSLIGREVLRDILLPISSLLIVVSGGVWFLGQLLCLAAPSAFGARWFNIAFVLVQCGMGPMQMLLAEAELRNVFSISMLLVGVACFVTFLRQLSLCLGQSRLTSRANVVLLAGAVTSAVCLIYFAIRGAGIRLLPGLGPITFLILYTVLFGMIIKLVRSLRIEARRALNAQGLTDRLPQYAVIENPPTTTQQ